MSKIRIYGNMDWFRVAEQPDSLGLLPEPVSEMSQLWHVDKDANLAEVIDGLSPYVGARFVADNLEDWQQYFSDASFGEFEAEEIRVVGVDFSAKPLPRLKAEAWFEIPLKDGITKADVVQWNENVLEGDLYGALIFYWDFEEGIGRINPS